MSTFDGFVHEFPQIRIDFFRTLPGRAPPLACFLSHVHSDHLLGLESFKSPFIYCSPATRQILLRLEKYPHRMNFAKGILECRKQTYTHLRKLLKPLPLETPTRIELTPGNEICVTLFDANHCVGAVLFLIEGNGRAVLYTGDIRAEPHLISHLCRHPRLVQYVPLENGGAGLRRLDTVYLDTTFAVTSSPYRQFPSKAAGLAELLQKLAGWHENTSFYFHSWTFGYEDVWVALSYALKSRIHLDPYRYRLYSSLSYDQGRGLDCPEAAILCGFKAGNVDQPGILTEQQHVRLHSCEKGTGCETMGNGAGHVVHIKPIVTRHNGKELGEMGIGGGQGDIDQVHELDLTDPAAVAELAALCGSSIHDESTRTRVAKLLERIMSQTDRKLAFDIPTEADNELGQVDTVPLASAVDILRRVALQSSDSERASTSRTITFPYSRHSSYDELRNLVAALRPRDVWPCTAPPSKDFTADKSMGKLFGDLCSDSGGESGMFAWDRMMEEKIMYLHADGGAAPPEGAETQRTQESFTTAGEDDDDANLESGHGRPHASQECWSSQQERLRARQVAYDAALEGRWDKITLQSTRKSTGRARSEEL